MVTIGKFVNNKMDFRILALFFIFFSCITSANSEGGNTTISSFNKAKKLLQKFVYVDNQNMYTLYCNIPFDKNKHINLPIGFKTQKYKNRLKRWEAEHVVPAENFGRTFKEWRDGSEVCVDRKGKAFKGRKCAEKANTEYRLMQSDLYNLYPVIGSVNAARQNYNFTMIPNAKSSFGSCDMLIDSKSRKVQPPESSRGVIARTYMYFEYAYPRYKMSTQQKKLMKAWDKQYPVSKWECHRSSIIHLVQGNKNPIMTARCNQ